MRVWLCDQAYVWPSACGGAALLLLILNVWLYFHSRNKVRGALSACQEEVFHQQRAMTDLRRLLTFCVAQGSPADGRSHRRLVGDTGLDAARLQCYSRLLREKGCLDPDYRYPDYAPKVPT